MNGGWGVAAQAMMMTTVCLVGAALYRQQDRIIDGQTAALEEAGKLRAVVEQWFSATLKLQDTVADVAIVQGKIQAAQDVLRQQQYRIERQVAAIMYGTPTPTPVGQRGRR